MATSLGALFLNAALGPLNYAGSCILGRQVAAGLNELAVENLMGAVRRGVASVAREAGVRASDVENHLPLAELQRVAGQVGERQRLAVEAWQAHAGHFGGLLEGVTDLTQDGRPPDVSLCLERLSQKVAADKAWARPLRELSADAYQWKELLLNCQQLLDSGPALDKARGRTLVRRIALTITVIVLALGSAAVGTWLWVRARGAWARVDAALADAEVCAVEQLAEDDLAWATDDQQSSVTERKRACAEQREQARQAREEQQRKEREAKRQARLRQQQEKRCAALVAGVTAGQLDAEQESLAGDAAPLLQRIAKGKLEPADLAPAAPKLPCAGTSSAAKLDGAFAKALVRSSRAWVNADDVSERAHAILTKHRTQLGQRAKLIFALRAETKAQRALVSGDKVAVARALRLCELKRSLEISRGGYCDALAHATKKSS